MKKRIIKIVMLLGLMTTVFSCSSDGYDDTELRKELKDLAERVTKLENTLTSMNRDIASIQAIVNVIQGYTYVTSIIKTETGYKLYFSSGNVVEINNSAEGVAPHIGSNGNWWIGNTDTGVKAAGSDGKDGKDGKDGQTPWIGSNGNWWIGAVDTGVPATGSGDGAGSLLNIPIIGVALYDGVYYWTQTLNGVTDWLYNTDGRMIPVVGNNGAENYRPIIQVNANGYWVISYDGGITFVPIYDENHNLVPATGGSGCNCETFFRSVSYYNGILVLVLIDGTVVTIDTNNEHDERLDDVVPPELQEAIAEHMPIYSGKNPPLIEGAYYLDPFVAVYCEDYGNGGFAPGYQVSSETIRFSNQNTTNNTLDIAEYSQNGNSSLEGTGAFISGSNGNFTAFFNTIGYSYNIYNKTALVISGTKTADGIADLYYAFVMVEKGYDPKPELMAEGIFRVFKDQDGLSVNTSWNGARSTENGYPVPEWTIYSAIQSME